MSGLFRALFGQTAELPQPFGRSKTDTQFD
jgi:hypothetical protein